MVSMVAAVSPAPAHRWHPAALLCVPPEQQEEAFESWVGDLRDVASDVFGSVFKDEDGPKLVGTLP
jgi:hypothetical protein